MGSPWSIQTHSVQACPVCLGRGSVAAGFYEGHDNTLVREQCRQCQGYGQFLVTTYGTVTPCPGAIPVFPPTNLGTSERNPTDG